MEYAKKYLSPLLSILTYETTSYMPKCAMDFISEIGDLYVLAFGVYEYYYFKTKCIKK